MYFTVITRRHIVGVQEIKYAKATEIMNLEFLRSMTNSNKILLSSDLLSNTVQIGSRIIIPW